ncbi:unnamed protein product, partial [Didymodactylos carnosus]
PFWISVRVAVAFIGFLGMMCHYSQKVNMSVAIVCMVNHSAIEHHKDITSGQTEESLKCSTSASSKIIGPFAWSKNIQGLVLGAYFWGYLITEIPAGWLAAKFGAKKLFGYAMLISGIITIVMPFAAKAHWITLSLLRMFVGLLHGVIWPSMATIMAHWAPPAERSRLLGFMNAGAQIGNVITLPLGAAMCTWHFAEGWPLIFYFTGGIGFIWSAVWLLFYADSPANQRCISQREKTYVLESTQHQLESHSKGEFNGMLSALPYIVFWININISGTVADFIVRKEILTRTRTRKLFNALANDIAPSYAGLVFGISNTFATLPGIISPYIVGAVTAKDPKNWRIVFFICAAIYCLGALVFLFIGSGDIQRWAIQNRRPKDEREALRLQGISKDDAADNNKT